MNAQPQTDVSMEVSIPGADPHATQNYSHLPTHEAPPTVNYDASGVNQYALEAACRAELSKGVHPKFYKKAVEMKAKSRDAGRPIFEDRDYVHITISGDRNSIHDREATPEDKLRWPALYAAYKSGQEVATHGTPLEQWPIMTPSKIANFKHNHVFTVEEVANLSDTAIQKLGIGVREDVNNAKSYLESAENSALPQRMSHEIEQLQNQVKALQESNNHLGRAAEKSQSDAVDLGSLREENHINLTKIQALEADNMRISNELAGITMEHAALKTEITTTKGQLTKAKKEIERLKNGD